MGIFRNNKNKSWNFHSQIRWGKLQGTSFPFSSTTIACAVSQATYPAIPAITIGVGSLPSAVQETRAPSFENSTRTNQFFVCQNRAGNINYVVQRWITLSTG